MNAVFRADEGAEAVERHQTPQTSAAVVRPGTTISGDLHQELAAVVGTTVARERLRLQVIAGLMGCGAVVTGLGKFTNTLSLGAYGGMCLVAVLPLMLVWGVRNRALLNAAAGNAAVDHVALARAVRLVQKRTHGPSAALQVTLPGARPAPERQP